MRSGRITSNSDVTRLGKVCRPSAQNLSSAISTARPVCHRRSASGQFQYGDFRPCAQADGGAGGSDAAVDVQLPAGFFVPSADVGSLRAYEGEAPIDKRERQLAAVAVPGQRQVDAQLGSAIKAVGIVAQKDVDHVPHHQFFISLEIPVDKVPVMISGESRLLIVNTDQVSTSPCD
jgi:hypothetical protein